jgi:hypothetical protein
MSSQRPLYRAYQQHSGAVRGGKQQAYPNDQGRRSGGRCHHLLR